MTKSMKQIAKFYLEWDEPGNRPHRNRHLTQLEELIAAIDTPRKGETPADAAIRVITDHLGDTPNDDALATLGSIIDADLSLPTSRLSAVEVLKHICMIQGGEAGKRTSVNPPNPWRA
jgi:hypothetical protein